MSKTRKGRGRSIREERREKREERKEKNEEIGFKREERRSEKSDLGVKDGREGRRFENDQWRWENRQSKKDERFRTHRSTTHHPNKLSPLNKSTR